MKTRIFLVYVLTIAFLLSGEKGKANKLDLFQTVRGTVIDHDTKLPLPGANIIVLGSDPFQGAASDLDGKFKFEKIRLGRINLQITCMGYETRVIPNLEVGSAKEVVLNVELTESLTKIDEVSVTYKTRKDEHLNKMVMTSGQTFTVEQTNRYAGALQDPARMAGSYAGISNDGEGSNQLIVRGNSPRGIQWRMEGLEIPNPSHFADDGSTGGAMNALNSLMLSNSDFFSGAFTAEYGNAYSGILDINLRSGNNEKHEQAFGFSTLGIDFTAEGPLKKGYSGSYLANYRYSSLDLLNKAGVFDFDGVPKFQDGSFKVDLPTKKAGKFSLYGLYGKSNMLNSEKDEETDVKLSTYDFGGNLGVSGISNLLRVGSRSYLKTSLTHNFTGITNDNYYLGNNGEMYHASSSDYSQSSVQLDFKFNSKINAKNTLKAGVNISHLSYDMLDKADYANTGSLSTLVNADGSSQYYQSFVNWKHRFHTNLYFVAGVHANYFQLNKELNLEPRLALKYKLNDKQSLSFAYGVHSKLESLSTYFVQLPDAQGNMYQPNKDLSVSKARHYVLGYNWQLNSRLHFKVETYFQDLYDVAVENKANSSIVLQDLDLGLANYAFVNEGTGKNYGVEFTLERSLYNRFYYLFTGSLYEAKFTALDGKERNSRYNGNYAFNFLFGKEFYVGKTKENTFALNASVSYRGGQYYTPLDLEASKLAGTEVYHTENAFGKRGDDMFILTTGFSYKINKKNTRHEFKLEVKNLTNNQATIMERYDEAKKEIKYSKQLPMIPNISYILYF